MKSIFSELPHDLIIDIIRIDNYRKKYDKVVEQINKVTTYNEFCPSIREMINDADDADPLWDVQSASQIWGWDENRVMNDLNDEIIGEFCEGGFHCELFVSKY